MTRNSKFALAAMVFAGAMAAGTAHARGHADVQWSVTIGSPGTVLGLPLPPVPMVVPRVVAPAPVYYPAPAPVYYPGRPYGWRDSDRDGIPNRYDRVDNRRWDRDGDGIPNRYDRHYNPRGDRDHDGRPNWRDRDDRHPGRR